jgi:hypothetical protein
MFACGGFASSNVGGTISKSRGFDIDIETIEDGPNLLNGCRYGIDIVKSLEEERLASYYNTSKRDDSVTNKFTELV